MKYYKSEFHVHTRFSHDSLMPLWLIKLICELKRIDTIAITDHNEIKGAIKLKSKFKDNKTEVIIGEEIFTEDGEIIGLDLKEKIEPGLSSKETIKRIKKQGGIVYIPHPYDEKRKRTVLKEKKIEENKESIDLIEVFNGRNIKEEFSVKQEEIAQKYGLKGIIGSDAHTFFELGRNNVFTPQKIMSSNILDSYSNPVFKKKKCIKYAHTATKLSRLVKIVLRGDYNEIQRIINRKRKNRM